MMLIQQINVFTDERNRDLKTRLIVHEGVDLKQDISCQL